MIQNDLHNYLGIEVMVEDPPTEEEILAEYMPDMWYEDKKGDKRLNENVFAQAFRDINHLQYNNGQFYSNGKKVNIDMVRHFIFKSLPNFGIYQNVAYVTNRLTAMVKRVSTITDQSSPLVPIRLKNYIDKDGEQNG